MYRVPKPGYDLATMRAVAAAYRRKRRAGRLDGPARDLYLGEELANRSTVDACRLQKLVTNMLPVIVYFELLWSTFS